MTSAREDVKSRSRSPHAREGRFRYSQVIIAQAAEGYKVLCEKHGVPESHGYAHARRVLEHVDNALEHASECNIPDSRALSIRLAALLHDADDHKYFKAEGNLQFPNARNLCEKAGAHLPVVDDVVKMIGWVSCSRNGNNIPTHLDGEYELLWPRWADRLEASGEIGVVRCWQYNNESNRPLFCKDTPRPQTEADVWSLATEARFEEYQRSGGKSNSMMDHYFDKLLRVASPDSRFIQNAYLEAEMQRMAAPLVQVCLEFGRTGCVPVDLIRGMAAKLAKN